MNLNSIYNGLKREISDYLRNSTYGEKIAAAALTIIMTGLITDYIKDKVDYIKRISNQTYENITDEGLEKRVLVK